MRVEHKVVNIIANPSVKEKCPVFLLDLYISRLPQEAKDKDLFFLSFTTEHYENFNQTMVFCYSHW